MTLTPQILAPAPRADETPEDRLKRMTMRSWRRGIKEMDMILGPWADLHLAGLDPETLDLYDRLLHENDQDIYPWITGLNPMPEVYEGLLGEIRAFARDRLRPRPTDAG